MALGQRLYDRSGVASAFVEDGTVFSYLAQHLGEFSNGFFRDRAGHAVAFIESVNGGLLLPITQPPPIPPIGTLSWSGATWDDFLRGVQ